MMVGTRSSIRVGLWLGVTSTALLAALPAEAQSSTITQPERPAQGTPGAAETVAPDQAAADSEIVVTGSSIRGAPPTGSSLIQLGAEDVVNTGAATTQELLSNVPQLASFNTAPRPGQRSNSSLSTGPDIRGIGQGATLSLVNGHRIVAVGALQNLPDPSFVPPSAIQRVEIVADGASATYGSDAVAGVVNVITRRDFEGLESSFRSGFGDHYHLLNTNAVTGSKWGGGGIIASVEYSATSRLRAANRDYLTNDFSANGGQDLRAIGNACAQATYRANNAAGAATGSYVQPATGAVDPRCVNYQYGDLYPRQRRLSFFGAGHQELSPAIELGFDAFYSKLKSDALAAPIYTTGVMTRANPFFPTSVPAGVNSITAYYAPSFLTGFDYKDRSGTKTYGGTITADVTLPHDFKWSTLLTGSRNFTDIREASFNPAANTALINATTADTALDPFANRTSSTSRVSLLDYENHLTGKQGLWEINSKVDGRLLTLPGGDLKIAVGGVYRVETYHGVFATTRIGLNENAQIGDGDRKVYSSFAELFVPIFGEDNGFTLMRALDISLAGRYDHYSDFGATKNPKVGVRWSPLRGISLRGSYGKSFHAPALNDLHAPDSRAGYLANGTLPPGFVQGSVPGGIFIAGGNPNLGPEKARNWSLGLDVSPDVIRGLRVGVTYYNLLFKDRISTPSRTFYTDPNFRRFIVDNIPCTSGTFPGGTGCQVLPLDPALVYSTIQGLPLTGFPRPVNSAADLPVIYNITLLRRANLSFIKTSGIDFDLSYRWSLAGVDLTTGLQGSYTLRYDQAAITGASLVDQFSFGRARFRGRASIAARSGPINTSVNVSHSGRYTNPYTLASAAQAFEKVGSFTAVDVHLGFRLPDKGMLSGTELVADVDNLFDQNPPELRSGSGYSTNANVLGRVVTIGIRKKF